MSDPPRSEPPALDEDAPTEVPAGDEPSLSLAEVAALLEVSPREVKQLLRQGRLVAAGDGTRVTETSAQLCRLLLLSMQVGAALERTREPGASLRSAGRGALLATLLVVWWGGLVMALYSMRGGKPMLPEWAIVAGTVVLLGGAWRILRGERHLQPFRGMGGCLYRRRASPDGVVTTAFLVVAMIPLLPVRSFVITDDGASTGWSATDVLGREVYPVRPLPGIDWPQAAPLCALGWAMVAAFAAAVRYL